MAEIGVLVGVKNGTMLPSDSTSPRVKFFS